jgi:hypothetical protein
VKIGVYLYFGGVLSDGATLLTRGSFDDLAELGLRPEEGLRLTFYDFDADDENKPTYLRAEGVLHFSEENQCWCAVVDNSTFHSRSRAD